MSSADTGLMDIEQVRSKPHSKRIPLPLENSSSDGCAGLARRSSATRTPEFPRPPPLLVVV
jgi:hypothetical protein